MALGPGCAGLVGGVLEASGQTVVLPGPATDRTVSRCPGGAHPTDLISSNQVRSELVAGPQTVQSTGFGLGQTHVVIY